MEELIMTLTRLNNNLWSPTFPSLINKFFNEDLMDWGTNFAANNSTMPAVNIKENENEFKIDVAAPGMNKSDFKVNYDSGRLVISAETKSEKEEKDGEKVTRKEFSYQSFQRTFNISENVVNVDKVEAKYEDGILHVILPKREEAKPKEPRQIAIS